MSNIAIKVENLGKEYIIGHKKEGDLHNAFRVKNNLQVPQLFNKLKAFITTEKAFIKKVTFIFSGKMWVTLLSLALTPIIARLFTPEYFGEYGLFNTAVKNLVVVGTLSLPLAVNTVKKKELVKVFNLTIAVLFLFAALFTAKS